MYLVSELAGPATQRSSVQLLSAHHHCLREAGGPGWAWSCPWVLGGAEVPLPSWWQLPDGCADPSHVLCICKLHSCLRWPKCEADWAGQPFSQQPQWLNAEQLHGLGNKSPGAFRQKGLAPGSLMLGGESSTEVVWGMSQGLPQRAVEQGSWPGSFCEPSRNHCMVEYLLLALLSRYLFTEILFIYEKSCWVSIPCVLFLFMKSSDFWGTTFPHTLPSPWSLSLFLS